MICYLAVHYVWIALGASLENLTIEGLDFLNMPVYVICGTGSRVEEVECWRLLHVTAYVRDYVEIQAPYKGDHGWDFYSSYWVNDWSEIQVVFQRFFDKGGFYHRVSFHVEVCYWNQSEGWSYDDRV